MKKLHLFILGSFVRPFLTSFMVVMFILELNFISTYKDYFVGKGLGAFVIIQVFTYASAQIVVLALPLSVLIASLMTLGSMGENYELASIRSAGISLFRVLVPMGLAVLGITLFSLFFTAEVVPRANLKLYSLLHDIQESKPALQLKPGHFFNGIDGYAIRVGDKNENGNTIYKVMIYDHTKGKKNERMIMADSGKMKVYEDYGILLMTLYGGSSHEGYMQHDKPTLRYGRTYFDTLVFRFDISSIGLKRSDESQFFTHQYTQNLATLSRSIDSCRVLVKEKKKEFSGLFRPEAKLDTSYFALQGNKPASTKKGSILGMFRPEMASEIIATSEKQAKKTRAFVVKAMNDIDNESGNERNYRIEFHRKFSLPLACIIFLFIGAPLGAILRKGGVGLPIVISIFFFIFYYVLMMQGKKLASDQVMPVWAGVWLPIIILSPLGIFLTSQSSGDSQLFQKSWWEAALYPVRRFFWLLITGRIFRAGYYNQRWKDILAGSPGPVKAKVPFRKRILNGTSAPFVFLYKKTRHVVLPWVFRLPGRLLKYIIETPARISESRRKLKEALIIYEKPSKDFPGEDRIGGLQIFIEFVMIPFQVLYNSMASGLSGFYYQKTQKNRQKPKKEKLKTAIEEIKMHDTLLSLYEGRDKK